LDADRRTEPAPAIGEESTPDRHLSLGLGWQTIVDRKNSWAAGRSIMNDASNRHTRRSTLTVMGAAGAAAGLGAFGRAAVGASPLARPGNGALSIDDAFEVNEQGNVGIGRKPSAARLAVNGTVEVAGVIQRGDGQVTTKDLGLYSLVPNDWMRFVTNKGAFEFYTDVESGTGAIREPKPSVLHIRATGLTVNGSLEINGHSPINGRLEIRGPSASIRLGNWQIKVEDEILKFYVDGHDGKPRAVAAFYKNGRCWHESVDCDGNAFFTGNIFHYLRRENRPRWTLLRGATDPQYNGKTWVPAEFEDRALSDPK
jgi:hypothetical protein